MNLKKGLSLGALLLLFISFGLPYRLCVNKYGYFSDSASDLFVPMVSVFLYLIQIFHFFFDKVRNLIPLVASIGNLLLLGFTFLLCVSPKSGIRFISLEPGFFVYTATAIISVVAAILHMFEPKEKINDDSPDLLDIEID